MWSRRVPAAEERQYSLYINILKHIKFEAPTSCFFFSIFDVICFSCYFLI